MRVVITLPENKPIYQLLNNTLHIFRRNTLKLLLFTAVMIAGICCTPLSGKASPKISEVNIFPKEGSELHYRLVGFCAAHKNTVNKYILEIAQGNFTTDESFKKNIINTQESSVPEIIGEVPSFGAEYTWRAIYKSANDTISGELHHFKTIAIPGVDTSIMRLRIMNSATTHKGAYVFADGNKVLYDMTGRAVWYLPNIEGLIKDQTWIRDLKLTSRGTITFILDEHHVYEIDYNGNILWSGPDNGSKDEDQQYHHEFTRMSNGHYMALGTRTMAWDKREPTATDKSLYTITEYKKAEGDEDHVKKFAFETLTEYDDKGKVIWEWKLSDYFKKSDLFYCKPNDGKQGFAVRVNSFYYDEKAKAVYLSFKNISRIVKIKYPEGDVINTYGEIYKTNVPQTGNPLFCHQHSCRISQSGNMYLFNNGCNSSTAPKVTIFKEPGTAKGQLKKVWEYDCSFDGTEQSAQSAAGNVTELDDNSLFVCMGTPYSKLLLVDMDRKIQWSALPERWDGVQKKWMVNPQYRASIIERKSDVEKMIWHELRSNNIPKL